ncbi:hypothetical protein [Pseudonocardia sp. HH130629-09]|uniref:hypothetical protein n=1 Tax=Pseudonocardia sp. HH130629-09 TaxID=1641402 RepID=UPI0006CB2A93|nr:hypothetical protein [Pseudonocardia sp. HH130629-09]ALE82514.1 hypothetical protein XF36_04610 [Pseudonocardia sp. HH130629-09]
MCTIAYRSRAEATAFEIRGPTWPVTEDGFTEEAFFRQPPDLEPMWIYCPETFNDQVHYMPNLACNGTEFSGGILGPTDLVNEAESQLSSGKKWDSS